MNRAITLNNGNQAFAFELRLDSGVHYMVLIDQTESDNPNEICIDGNQVEALTTDYAICNRICGDVGERRRHPSEATAHPNECFPAW